MEIKKYVLTTDGYIYKKKQVKQHKDANTTHIVSFGIVSYHLINIKKTSDNILDLLENKDLVELKGGDGNDNDVHMIVNVIDGDMITWDKLWIYKERDRDTIVAIYKRTRNGDYKRYEVENNE